MTAIIRVKRHLDEDPLDALVINCKRRKISNEAADDEESITTVSTFAGTVKTQDDIVSHINNISKEELKKTLKRYEPNVLDKIRSQTKADSNQKRFKVLNCFRALEEHTDDTNYTVVEVERHRDEQKKEETSEKDFVYDLYYTATDGYDMTLDNLESINPLENELVYDYADFGNESHDSEDSNAEDYYRNDYPDESHSDNSLNEEDMLHAMRNCKIDDLSSDDGEEGFAYSIDSEAAGFEEDIDDSDVMRYGERYARHKSRRGTYGSDSHHMYYGDIDSSDDDRDYDEDEIDNY